jgi:hypothetical protein
LRDCYIGIVEHGERMEGQQRRQFVADNAAAGAKNCKRTSIRLCKSVVGVPHRFDDLSNVDVVS